MWEEKEFLGDGFEGHGPLKGSLGAVWVVWSVEGGSTLPTSHSVLRAEGGRGFWWEQHEKLVIPLHKTRRELEKMLKNSHFKAMEIDQRQTTNGGGFIL